MQSHRLTMLQTLGLAAKLVEHSGRLWMNDARRRLHAMQVHGQRSSGRLTLACVMENDVDTKQYMHTLFTLQYWVGFGTFDRLTLPSSSIQIYLNTYYDV